MPYKSLQESVAIAAWRKKERIELLKVIAMVSAVVNPEKAAQATRQLIEEMFPEHKIEREKSVERALEIMESERHKSYSVVATDQSAKANPFESARRIMNRRGGKKPNR